MRKHLVILGIMSSLLAACDGSSLGIISKPGTAISATGQAVVSIISGGSRASQAAVSDVNRLEISITSSAQPVMKSLTRSQITSGSQSVVFDSVPVGTASFKVAAFDNTNVNIGEATASAQILEGQTINVSMALKLGPTYVTENATGSATAQVSILDGDVIKIQPASSNTYDPLLDSVARVSPSISRESGVSAPNLVAVSFSLLCRDSNGNQLFYKNSTIVVDYKLYEATWNNIKGALLASGQTTFTDGNIFNSRRTIEVPKKTITETRWAMMDLVARLPNGKVLYSNDTSSWTLQTL